MRIFHLSLGKHQTSLAKALSDLAGGDYGSYDWQSHHQAADRQRQILSATSSEWRIGVTHLFAQLQTPVLLEPGWLARHFPNALRINWSGDIRDNLPQYYVDQAKNDFQISAFSNLRDVNEMNQLGHVAKYLDIGFEEPIFNFTDNAVEHTDIVFFGNNYASFQVPPNTSMGFPLSHLRQEMVTTLKGAFGRSFYVFGSSWGNLATGNLNSNPAKEAAIYRGCKVAINLSHYDVDGYSSDRLYRMLACGAYVLSFAHVGLDKQFKVGEELDVWRTMDELLQKVRFALENHAHRARVAEAGREKAWSEFRWSHRLKPITQW